MARGMTLDCMVRSMRAGVLALAMAGSLTAGAAAARAGLCYVPAKPGGGFDLTCKLAQVMLADAVALQPRYLPGGIGALAYTTIVDKQPAEPSTIVAFSSGSLLNLAQGKFGPHTEHDVRWLAVVGTDYGVVAVRKDSKYRSLGDLLKGLREDPRSIVFGAGGTIGSQDWFKAALLARAAGASHKAIRFVAFEGGGDALAALEGGHVAVFTGDAGEVSQYMARSAGIRLLAVLSRARLPGRLGTVPTAREQGVDLVWPTARGFYMGPKVPEQAYREWSDAMRKAMAEKGFAGHVEAHGLYPMSLTGTQLQEFITTSMKEYRRLAAEFELPKR
jgi:putative tricarboxylic transport membrane protein